MYKGRRCDTSAGGRGNAIRLLTTTKHGCLRRSEVRTVGAVTEGEYWQWLSILIPN